MEGDRAKEEREGNYWHKKWKVNDIGFHKDTVNECLINNMNLLTGGKKQVKIFVSLCGKSPDLKWLADQGHDVIGLEFSELATKSFFEEQHLNYTVSPVETIQGASVFKADDCQIQIYCCDFFAFTSAIAGQFDAVWDRHAFGAVLPKRRTQYSENLMSLMKPDGNCLMMTAQYDATVMQGPPFNVRTELIQEFFGDRCDIRKIEQGDAMRDKWRAKGHKWFEWVLHHLSCKQ
ncbi:probable thiopurine S-methyltransferase isoform X2 [Ptychodera flava]|uniref:probable thiopurine S-methyltransferase isoform X2 n=2 Tax=Ptychodera flava TaxID=63121 RepID=UPI00396AA5C1